LVFGSQLSPTSFQFSIHGGKNTTGSKYTKTVTSVAKKDFNHEFNLFILITDGAAASIQVSRVE